MNKKVYYAVLLVLVVAVAAFYFVNDRKRFITTEGVVWTTEYHITYEANRNMADSIEVVLTRIDESASAYNQMSLVSQFNTTGEVVPDSLLNTLMQVSQGVYEKSEGAFDPTIMPLVQAYKKAAKAKRTPSQGYIDSLCTLVGFSKLKFEAGTIKAGVKGMALDFSAVAKGLACDEVGRMFERNGVVNYLVEIGGEVVAKGVNDRGTQWKVSVDLPSDQVDKTEHASAMVVALDKASVATSGNYRQFAEVGGKRVTHIINPHNGKAEQSDLLSVTIIAPQCVSADAWATACMAMGTKATQELMESNDQLGVLTISADEQGNYVVWSNNAFTKCVPE